MEQIKYETRNYTEESWRKAHNGAPLPLEAFGYPIWQKHESRTKRQKQEDHFAKIYDKLKAVEFKTEKQLSMSKFIGFPIFKKGWSFSGSKNACAVYPVLCAQANFRPETEKDQEVQISRENIAKLAGISTAAVDKGVSTLEEMHFNCNGTRTLLLERRLVQDGKRRYYVYKPGFIRPEVVGTDMSEWKNQWFPFHTCIINSGIWAKLSRRAKAIYLAMRSVSYFPHELYTEFEPAPTSINDRKWEISEKPLTELFDLTDIYYQQTKQVTDELEEHGLVEKMIDGKSVFKVWLKPKDLVKSIR